MIVVFTFFVFMQTTADEMRISDWSSDVCSSDLPADPFLDMAGEDLRRRIFLTESETGQSLCLRPEFTIPVCLDHIASQAGTPRRYSYLGEVFRQRSDERRVGKECVRKCR